MPLENTQKHVHFIGIGGVGMSGLARILLEKGVKVSGSDIKDSPTVNKLKEVGAKIFIGHKKENIQDDVDDVVISTAIPTENDELVEARKRGLRILHRSDILAQLMLERKGIAIAGAHGKTTTTSMISHVMERNGCDPTVVVGGVVFDMGSNAKLGCGEYLVAEADESDGSFLKLSPYIAVITNIENDHLDYYGTTDRIDAAFEEFVQRVPDNGECVFCFNNAKVRELATKTDRSFVSYGVEVAADYQGRNIRYQGTKSIMDVYYKDDFLGTLELNVPGEHNMCNALATLAVGKLTGLSFEQVATALRQFTGVGRRFQLTGKVDEITVVDDYAHHPTEIKATLQAAKKAGFARVVGVFQPHRYTRTNFLFKEFGEAFGDADMVIITDIYSAGEAPIAGVDAKLIVNEVKKNTDVPVYYLPNSDEIISFLLEEAKQGDLIITLGAGNIWNTGVELVKRLKEG